jgi:ATP-dependent Clp protease adapter protein ClpS
MGDRTQSGVRIQLLPERQTEERIDDPYGESGPWVVVLYNDDWHPFDQVVRQVEKATGCSETRAYHITAEAHTRGRAIAMTASKEECERAAAILREIRLQVETDAF